MTGRHFHSPFSRVAERSWLGAFYRFGDAVCILLSLGSVAALSLYSLDDPHWQALYLLAGITAVGLFFLFAEYQGLYVAARGLLLRQELFKLGSVWIAVLLSLLLLAYGVKVSAEYPRRVMLTWFLVAPVVLFFWRVGFGLLLRKLRSDGYGQQRAAVVGAGEVAHRIAQTLHQAPWMGVSLLGFYDDEVQCEQQLYADLPQRVCGDIRQLLVDAHARQLDAIYIALPAGQDDKLEQLVDQLADTPASVYVIPNLFMLDLLHARWLSLNGVPVVSVYETPFYGVDGTLKRLLDICFSAVILLLIALPMLGIALAVKLTSPGPVIFKQRRYGLDGRDIIVWKFRTMTVCEDDRAFSQAKPNDPRITPIGAFLRRHSLDELPQFINVLQGRMSIVGPRPHPVMLNEQHRHLIRGYMLRHRVKPGITGWAQVNGARGETETLEKMQKRIELDLAYIRNWTLWLDFRIIAKTIINGFADRNAY